MFFICGDRTAFGKEVTVRWDPVPGAIQYDLRLKSGNRELESQRINSAKVEWRGDLKPGFYEFQVRAVDWAERPGTWSVPKPILVLPLPPSPLSPNHDTHIAIDPETPPSTLEWSEVIGADSYHLEVRHKGKTVVSSFVNKTQSALPYQGEGLWQWRVASVVTAPETSKLGRFIGEPSDWNDFTVEKKAQPVATREVAAHLEAQIGDSPRGPFLRATPHFSFGTLYITDRTNNTEGHFLARPTPGLQLLLGVPLESGITPFFSFGYEELSLLPPRGISMAGADQVFGSGDVGAFWRLPFWNRVVLSLMLGYEQHPLLSAPTFDSLAITAVGLLKFSGFGTLEFLRGRGWGFALEGGASFYFSRITTVQSIRGGFRYEVSLSSRQGKDKVRFREAIFLAEQTLDTSLSGYDRATAGVQAGVEWVW